MVFTKFCAQFTFSDKMADEPCPTSLQPSTDAWARLDAGLIFLCARMRSALDPPPPIGAAVGSLPPRRLYSARVPSPISAATPRLPRVDDASIGRRRSACRARLPLLQSTPALPWTQSAFTTPSALSRHTSLISPVPTPFPPRTSTDSHPYRRRSVLRL